MSLLKEMEKKGILQPGQGRAATELLRARTGKEITQSGPRASDLEEQAAASKVRKAAQEQDRAEQVQGLAESVQREGQSEEQRQARAQFARAAEQAARQTSQQLSSMFQEFEQNKAEMTEDERQLAVERMAFLQGLKDRTYMTNLDREGQRRRLSDAKSFDRELARSVFSDELEILKSDADFRKIMAADENEFLEQLANIDIDTAIAVANSGARASNIKSAIEGAGELGAAFIRKPKKD